MKLYIPLLKFQKMKINGNPRYIGPRVIFDDFDEITIGDRTVISDECHLLTHDYSLTTALISIGEKPETDKAQIKSIIIGNNCFIGKKSIIMPGTQLGDNIIVGAGSVVRGKVESNKVIIGNPAQIVSDIDKLGHKWKGNLAQLKLRID